MRGDATFLVDAGTGMFDAEIAAALADRGIEHLDGIVLTHAHFDHSAGAPALSERFGSPVLAHEDAVDPLARGDGLYTCASLFGSDQPKVACEGIREGAALPFAPGWRVIGLPGHHPSSIVLLDDRGRLFSGDVVFADGGVGRWDLPGGDFSSLLRSVERLAALDVRSLYPGHGPPAEGNGADHIRLSLSVLRSCINPA